MAEKTSGLYIDGKWTHGTGAEQITVINPATEAVIGTVPQASVQDVQDAIRSARAAFDDGPWPRMSPVERAAVLTRMGEIIERRYDELVELNIAETGATRSLANSLQVGIPVTVWMDTATRVLPRFEFETPLSPNVVPGLGIGQGIVARQPFGVASLITPFNFPFLLNVFKVASALAAGCTAILKPSPYTPFEALIFGEIAEEAGLPAGVLNVVTGDIEAGEILTRDPMIDIVSFTGSDAVGRKVYTQAADSLKKVVLELGGKSANILCEDADLDSAVLHVLAHTITHCGQGCAILSRTLVHQSLHDDLVNALTTALSNVTIGDPVDETIMMGPLIREQQRTRVEGLIAAAVDDGAEIVFGGKRPQGLDKGFFVEPTVFTGVSNDMRIAQEEVFGPVNVIIPFSDDHEAVRIANDSEYGLGGGVWSRDPVRALTIARQLHTGTVGINGGGVGLSQHAPFGGYKKSGLGREFGTWGMQEYLQHKSIEWSAR
jgi:aldehyde dehydrogenase (NAD+)